MPVAAPLLRGLGSPLPVVVLALAGAAIITLRHIPDWQRRYEPGLL